MSVTFQEFGSYAVACEKNLNAKQDYQDTKAMV